MGRTRIAAVQLAYHPALLVDRRSPLEDPLFEPGKPDTLTVAGEDPPEHLRERLAELRSRIRDAYNAQLRERVRAILQTCVRWEAQVVVFPEYSIPWEILGDVADAAGELVVVAGTHSVEQRGKKSGIYARLGATTVPSFGQSVCPVLHRGRLISLHAKMNPAVPERGHMKEGETWAPVEMPEELPGPMGVMVCLDFLFREGEKHQKLVAEKLPGCRFLAVPSLTPWHTLPEFAGKAWEEARRYGRPVVYCDGSEGGGTSVYVDEGRLVDLKSFPEHVGWLDAGDEGLIVADVDLGYERPGESTRYEGSPPVVPVAAATLVYRANPAADAYAAWLAEAGELLARDDDDAVEALAEKVAAGKEVLRGAGQLSGGARERRLGKLVREIEGVTRVEQIRQLTREVVLRPGVLPPVALRVGLARGAADEIHRWVTEPGAGGLGKVVDALRNACAEMERKAGPWGREAQQAIEGVSAAVRGGGRPVDQVKLIAYTGQLEDVVEHGFEEAHDKASELFIEGRYEEARAEYARMLERALPLAERGDEADRPRLRRWVEQCRFNVALATLNLQEHEEARRLLLLVEPAHLSVHGRILFAETLATIGDQARALEVMPSEAEVPQEESSHLLQARQLFEILQGRVPANIADPSQSPENQVRAAALLLDLNNLTAASALALQAIHGSNEHPLIFARGVVVITDALRRTVHEIPPDAILVPVEFRSDFINLLDTYFSDREARKHLPAKLTEGMQQVERMFRSITGESQLDDSGEALHLPDPVEVGDREEGGDHSDSSTLDEHPWHQRLVQVGGLAQREHYEEALTKALVLVLDFPERAPIEHVTAQICAKMGRPAEALEHAEVAYKNFPAKGYLLLLAAQRLSNDKLDGAWDLVKDLHDDRPAVLGVRMVAAERTGHWEDAESTWHRYLEQRPDDIAARIDYARLLFRMDRREEAVAAGWKLYEEHGDKLDAEALCTCAWLQRMTNSLATKEVRRRLLDIDTRLDKSFAASPDMDRWRRYVRDMLTDNVPADVAPTGSEHERAVIAEIARLARLGAMPITAVAEKLSTSISLVVTRVLEHRRAAYGNLNPPASASDVVPLQDLRGARILVSELELVLLEALDLTDALRDALGPEGRLVLLPGAQNRLHRDFSDLHIDADREKLRWAEAFLREVEQLPQTPTDVSAVVLADGLDAEERRFPWRTLLVHLYKRGVLGATQLAKLGADGASEATDPPTLPDHLIVPWHLARRLFQADALRSVFDALAGHMFLDEGVRSRCWGERDDLLSRARAAELTRKVHARLSESWIHKEHREPNVSDLPPLRDPQHWLGQELLVEPLREAITYRRTMLDNPTWWRLSAEVFDRTAFGVRELMAQFAWAGDEAYRAVAVPLGASIHRDLTLPTLIRALKPDPNDELRRRSLFTLAELGFPDALGALEILALAREYGDLDGAEPQRVLDAEEWMAVEPRHVGAAMARHRLAYAYAAALFNTFLAPDLPDDRKKSVLSVLLHRQEIIAQKTTDNTLDLTFGTLAYATTEEWQRAWKPHEDGGGAPDVDGKVALLWKAAYAWAGFNRSRRAAYGRALREIWRVLSDRPGGPPAHIVTTLGFAQHPVEPEEASAPLPDSEALWILSALWDNDPFRKVLDKDVARLSEYTFLLGGRHPVINHGAEPDFLIGSVEALLLRASPSDRAACASRIMLEQGRYDGICYRFLQDTEQSPKDRALLQRYAAYASTAFFRLVQEDPAFLRVWWQAQRLGPSGERHRLDELIEILSEERGGILGDGPMSTILTERFDEGCWSNRQDQLELFELATEVPGALLGYVIGKWLEDETPAARVESALHAIGHSDEYPIARVARAVLFLRAVAARRPLVRLPEGEADLREILPARLERLLKDVLDQPSPDSIGAAEGALLRVCGEVIQRLAHPRILPFREGLWLTWRLFQWLCLQLEAITPDVRVDGIRHLVDQAAAPGAPRDVLDPLGFGRDHFNHRLAAVLHALGTMDDLVALLREEWAHEDRTKLRSVSSPALEEKLIELARGAHIGPDLGSVLEWNAPGNVPDLALNALLSLNTSRFADLGPEARARRFEALPDDPEALQTQNQWTLAFATRIVQAAGDTASALAVEERTLLETKVRAMKPAPLSLTWRWVTFVSLFAAGVDHLESEALTLTIEHVADAPATFMFARLLVSVAARDPARIEPTANAVLNAAIQHDASVERPAGAQPLAPGLAVGALGWLLVHGRREGQQVARTLLLRLAECAPFRDDPRMRKALDLLGPCGA